MIHDGLDSVHEEGSTESLDQTSSKLKFNLAKKELTSGDIDLENTEFLSKKSEKINIENSGEEDQIDIRDSQRQLLEKAIRYISETTISKNR